MRARLLQVFVLMFCSAMLAACSGGASDASSPAPIVSSNNDKLPACTWGTSNWGGCSWQ